MSEAFRLQGSGFELVWGTPDEAQPRVLRPGDLPRLREETGYPVFLRSTGNLPVALVSADPALLGGLRTGDHGRVMYGTINFGSQVGRSALAVWVDGREAVAWEVEVAPTKLDYRQDYLALLADTQDLLTGLVLEWLRATYRYGAPTPTERPGRLEWLTLLRSATAELERSLGEVARRPHWGLTREANPARAERVRHPDPAMRRAVLRGIGSGAAIPASGTAVRERLIEHRARATLDTAEHRWLAGQLRTIRRRLAQLVPDDGKRAQSPRRARTTAELRELAARIGRLEQLQPLAASAGDPPVGWASLQLLSAPGYREAYRACGLLSQGLRVEGGPARLALKDLHLLYEQWCFLALVALVAEALGQPLPATDLLTTEGESLRVGLRRGHEHPVRFATAQGTGATLTYNPRFGDDPLLVPQRPDILLEIHRPGRPTRRLVLDAKYRLDGSPGYVQRYGVPGPPEEALNGLHRYRDALGVSQAIALFPGRPRDQRHFRTSRLRESIARIGVGALPLLPGETGLVAEWVRDALGVDERKVLP